MIDIRKMVNEITNPIINNDIFLINQLTKKFIKYCIKNLRIKRFPEIILTNRKSDTKTLGHNDVNNFQITVYTKNRLVSDIFRTIAHELVHTKQYEDGLIDSKSGDTGSSIENIANSKSAILIRHFGQLHPEIYELPFESDMLYENFDDRDREREEDFEKMKRDGGNIEMYKKLIKTPHILIKEENKDHKHEFGCLMFKVPFKNWSKLLNTIDKDDLYTEEGDDGYGLETESHVTVLYGLHEEVDEKNLIDWIKDFSKDMEYHISISKMGVFKNSKFEVLKLDVDSESLKYFNKKLCENFPYTSKFPEYNPHITIAYLKKGTSQKYLKKISTPIELNLETLIYSKVDGKKTTFHY